MTRVPYARPSLTTLKEALLIYLIEACCRSGDDEIVNSLCKYMMQFLSNIPRSKRMMLSQRFWQTYERLSYLIEDENSTSHLT